MRTRNQIMRSSIDFGSDPVGTSLFEQISAVQSLPMQGNDGYLMAGDKGDSPSGQSFNGDLGRNPQNFTSSILSGNVPANQIGNRRQPSQTFETTVAAAPSTDPFSARMYDRLAGRKGRR